MSLLTQGLGGSSLVTRGLGSLWAPLPLPLLFPLSCDIHQHLIWELVAENPASAVVVFHLEEAAADELELSCEIERHLASASLTAYVTAADVHLRRQDRTQDIATTTAAAHSPDASGTQVPSDSTSDVRQCPATTTIERRT